MLVIVAGCMVMFMAAGAMAIDLGSGRQSQTKAQSTADAAAEAGANAIPYPACSSSDTTCINTVKAQAATIATQNGACATCVTVNYPYPSTSSTGNQIQVLVSGSSSGSFGGRSGRSTLPISASAIAAAQTTVSTSTSTSTSVSYSTTTSTSTTVTPATNTTPTAIFASDSKCSDNGLTIGKNLSGSSPANNINLQGSIYSNGNIGVYYANGNFGSSITYGSGCAYNHSSGGNYNGGQATSSSTVASFPDDFRNDTIPCDFSATTYSWTSGDQNLSPGIYCASKSITVNIPGNNLNASGVTFIAPQVSITASNCNMSPAQDAPDNLEIFNKGTSALTIDCDSNLNAGGGAIFSPSSAINITAVNFNNSEFLEGYQVHIALTDANGDQGSINISGNGAASGPNSTATTSTQTSTYTNSSTMTNTTTTPYTTTDGSALTG